MTRSMTGACRSNLSLEQLQDWSVPKLYVRGKWILGGCGNIRSCLFPLETSMYLHTSLHRGLWSHTWVMAGMQRRVLELSGLLALGGREAENLGTAPACRAHRLPDTENVWCVRSEFFVPVESSPDGPTPHSCTLGALPPALPGQQGPARLCPSRRQICSAAFSVPELFPGAVVTAAVLNPPLLAKLFSCCRPWLPRRGPGLAAV